MLEQMTTTIDLTKGLSKLPSRVEGLQAKMHQQVERLDSAMEQQRSFAATLLTNLPKPALASIDTNKISKTQERLDAQASRLTDVSATIDEVKASMDEFDGDTKQCIVQLESKVNSQVITLQTLAPVPSNVTALEAKHKAFSDQIRQKNVSTSADPTVVDALKQHATQLKSLADQLEGLSGAKFSIDALTEDSLDHASKIEDVEENVKKILGLQEQIESIKLSFNEQEVVHKQIEDLPQRTKVLGVDVAQHVEDFEHFDDMRGDGVKEILADVEKHSGWLKQDEMDLDPSSRVYDDSTEDVEELMMSLGDERPGSEDDDPAYRDARNQFMAQFKNTARGCRGLR
ncbi:hypothetical protein N0V86_005139 [Didymella sp. IMI 355093]|nr:hypothetical protein N0V86_005139 [Didymella sp. IMI 355093]